MGNNLQKAHEFFFVAFSIFVLIAGVQSIYMNGFLYLESNDIISPKPMFHSGSWEDAIRTLSYLYIFSFIFVCFFGEAYKIFFLIKENEMKRNLSILRFICILGVLSGVVIYLESPKTRSSCTQGGIASFEGPFLFWLFLTLFLALIYYEKMKAKNAAN